ncbi:hypothetical protein [Aquidulcibacter paucihalophilus]|uniref:hypothetical protein n=1 Tax=Aquidulcibacter paucihalophilus TaxID=1978549 RepID=UPI000A19AC07|nr:hypothetical protein [Aquidulcibacter paucihalophilus]
MNRRSLIQLLSIGVLPLAASCARTPERIQKGQNTFYYGHITSGSFHEVNIGDDHRAAKAKLIAMGLLYSGLADCEKGFFNKIECNPGEIVEIFRKHSFLRSGFVFLFLEREKVAGIAWSYNYSIDT